MRRVRGVWLVVAAAAAGVACSGGGSTPPPYWLETTGGTYDDGSGRLGLAVLATLRDASGAGPQDAWTGTLSDGSGPLSTVQYDAPGAGSYVAFLEPSVAPASGGYGLELAPSSGSGLRASFSITAGSSLPVPQVSLSADGATLSWPAVAGAATYECRVLAGGALQRTTLGAATSCPVGDLPAGAYEATVLAYSADLSALASSAQRPSLPPRFDVSAAQVAFSVPQPGAPAFSAHAAGGAIDYSGGTSGLAFWLSITQADGTASQVSWTVQVAGPGLPWSYPLTVTYGANLPRALFWSYDVPATSGTYSFTATSSAGTLAGSFTVGTPVALDVPQGVSASGGFQGSATVSWSTVAGARSYLASAYDHSSGALVASQWVSGSSATFPQGSFVSGATYDVYVDATDADMLGGAVPTQVTVSENTFQPSSFVAP